MPHTAHTPLRFTPPRQRVYQTVQHARTPLKAYDIIEALGDVKPMTVYRALEFLAENGLVHRIESLNAYVACREDHCQHRDSQYFVCDGCGTVQEIHHHTLNRTIADTLTRDGLRVHRMNLELHGVCPSCQ